jgi:hypothetical protein
MAPQVAVGSPGLTAHADRQGRLLEYVIAVAEELHLGRAAARMHVTQQSVSEQIRRLEIPFLASAAQPDGDLSDTPWSP